MKEQRRRVGRGRRASAAVRRPFRTWMVGLLVTICLLAAGCRTVSEPKRLPRNPYIKPPKEEKASWLGSWFHSKASQRPESVVDFLEQERP